MNKQSNSQSKYLTPASSALSGLLSRAITYPIQLTKARIQVKNNKIQRITSYRLGLFKQTFLKIISQQGVKGLYRGVGIASIGNVPGFCTYMTTYEISKRKLSQILPNNIGIVYLLSGFIAEAISCLCFLPVDIIKQRLQVQNQLKTYSYANSFDAAKQIRSKEGLIGLYRAFGATLMFFGPFSALYFYFYQNLKTFFLKDNVKPKFMQSLLLAGTAGSLAGYLTHPLQLCKLRLQIQRAQGDSNRFGYKNTFHGISQIIKHQGFFALFRGAFIRMFFTTPFTAISMSLTQFFKQKLTPLFQN